MQFKINGQKSSPETFDSTFPAIYTDMYQLTMMNAYFKEGRQNTRACFDYFFRKLPFKGGYAVFAGISDLLRIIRELRFSEDSIDYLRKYNFDEGFLATLKNFRFTGTFWSVNEGEVVFPVEPLVRVEGKIMEVQLIETLLLNFLNFETLVATKASRMRLAAGNRNLSEFGLRRAPALGGIFATHAAIIGGFDTTSNVYSAKIYGIEPAGTMAHSFIESSTDELTAFRNFAESFPGNCILLVDTYDTINSGIPNAIIVAKELEKKGKKLAGIRLDSGDLAFLSKLARSMLNDAGLDYVRIAVSNKLDEHVINSLINQKAPVDFFGVGTSLVTGQPDAALDGVYKLSMADSIPRLKLSETISKATLPGIKEVYRFYDDRGFFFCDAISLFDEGKLEVIYHPFEKEKSLMLSGMQSEKLLNKVMDKGKIVTRDIQEKNYVIGRLSKLPEEHKRFENPHIYKVGISEGLQTLRDEIRSDILSRIRKPKANS